MRTTQYVFVLISQVVMLGAVFTFGNVVVDTSLDQGSTPTGSEVSRTPGGSGFDTLNGYLSR